MFWFRMGSGFDTRVNCGKMEVVPAESGRGSRFDVIFLPRTAKVPVEFNPARLLVVKMFGIENIGDSHSHTAYSFVQSVSLIAMHRLGYRALRLAF